MGRSVGLYDTTLRDGEQTVGVALGPQAKLRIARAIDELSYAAERAAAEGGLLDDDELTGLAREISAR